LQARLADQLPLTIEERTALEAELAEAERQVTAFEQRKATLEAWLRWHDSLEKAITEERSAQAQVVQARAVRDAASGRRAALLLVESVQPARALAEDCRRLAIEQAAAVSQYAQAQEAASVAETAVRAAETALQEGRTVLEQAEAALNAAAPKLANARDLATQIESLKPGHADARQMLESSQQALLNVQQSLQEKQASFNAAQADWGTTSAWLSSHATRQALAGQWPRWEALLSQAEVTLKEVSGATAGLKAITDQVSHPLPWWRRSRPCA
jgi:exonuclease SbcC